MSSRDLERIGNVTRILRNSARGLGVAASTVEVFGARGQEDELGTVRSILLGIPPERCFSRLSSDWGAAGDLLRFLVTQGKVNAPEASRRGEKISVLFERWAMMNQRRVVEQNVVAFRSLLVSGVLGAVCAIIASITPFLASFQLSLSPQPASPWYVPYAGLLFAVPGSSFLGVFVAQKRAFVNVFVCALSYILALYLFGPVSPVGR